jgi:hypothetical protein
LSNDADLDSAGRGAASSKTGALMKMKLREQSVWGILNSLIARLLLENEQEGLAILFHALRYLNSTATVGC